MAVSNPRTLTGVHDAYQSRSDALWLTGLILLAFALRIPGLDASLWYDEAYTLAHYVRPPLAETLLTYEALNNHVFHTVLAKASVTIFGESAWALRLPAMLFGVASVWALWQLCREVVGPWETRLAALLMAVSYHHVWFSQNARGYTGLLFFGLLATWLLVCMVRRPTWRGWIAYGICLALAMYTHLSAAFFFLAHGVAFMLVYLWRAAVPVAGPMPSLWKPAVGCGLGLIVTFALYSPVIGQMVEAFAGVKGEDLSAAAEASIAEWKSPLWMLEEVAAGFGAFGPIVIVIVPVVLAVLLIGGIALFRRTALVPLTLVLHVALTVAILVALSFRVWPRYFLIDIGLICLLLIHGAFVIGNSLQLLPVGDWWSKGERLGIALAALGVAASLVLLPKNYLHPKQNYRGATNFIEEHRSPDSTVITVGLGATPWQNVFAPQWKYAETLEQFRQLYTPGQETWVVYTFPDVNEHRHAAIFQAAAGNFEEARYFHGTLNDGGIVVLRSKEP